MKTKSIKVVDVDDLVIVPECQRRLNQKRVDKIIAKFDPDLIGQVVVSEREDGTLVLLDGQHRRSAIIQLRATGADIPSKVSAEVFTGLTKVEEAKLFLGFNNAVVPPWSDKFLVRLTADDDVARALRDILHRNGWQVSNVNADGTFRALATLERVYLHSQEMGIEPNLAEEALKIVTEAWGHSWHAPKGPFLEGIAAFIYEYTQQGFTIDRDRIVEKLATFPFPVGTTAPQAFMAQARVTARTNGVTASMGVAMMLVKLYNRNKSGGNLLPMWQRVS